MSNKSNSETTAGRVTGTGKGRRVSGDTSSGVEGRSSAVPIEDQTEVNPQTNFGGSMIGFHCGMDRHSICAVDYGGRFLAVNGSRGLDCRCECHGRLEVNG